MSYMHLFQVLTEGRFALHNEHWIPDHYWMAWKQVTVLLCNDLFIILMIFVIAM